MCRTSSYSEPFMNASEILPGRPPLRGSRTFFDPKKSDVAAIRGGSPKIQLWRLSGRKVEVRVTFRAVAKLVLPCQ
jgi:hypothetical protein